ncbi:MAG: glycosyltransferase family 1 protein [Sulfobacillus acidophilus]|uniref:Glycosyltransferase family 1 protein n=1 Tax=Sulfobacillus acidophilus TaxID=53633 RepID=A0A2T2WNY8_9FIRM|nr:MAG: glycosyltransferase family 1 protein [Sulfobacillus acidophilus]
MSMPKRIKLGLFTYGMASELTGIGRYARELSYALRRLDLPLDIVLLSPYPNSKLSWYRDFPVYPVPALKRLPSVMVRGHRILAQASIRLGLDILHDPCGIAPFLSTVRKHKKVVTIHDAIPVVHPELQPLATKLVYHSLLRWAPWSSNAIITISNHAQQDLARTLNIPRNHIFVTPLGAAIPSIHKLSHLKSILPEKLHDLSISNPYFLWVGGNSPRKNLNRVLAAFESLRLDIPAVQLILVGPQPARATSWPFGVRHVGYVRQSILELLYLGAQALVYPSLYEGFGVPIVEAMAHGTPVITSNCSSMPEVSGHAALIVDPTNVADIKAAMAQCLDVQTHDEFGLRGRMRVRQFQWENTAIQTFRIYEKLLSSQSGQPSGRGVS